MPQPAFVERRPAAAALLILALCFLTNLVGRGLVESYPIFMLPLEREFGWSRTQASGVYSAAFIVTGTVGPLIGWLFDRFGPARLYAIGLVVLALAAVAASRAAALWQFYASLGLLFGLGFACIGTVPMASLLSRWFHRRLNTALALAYASGGLGILVMAPTAQALLDSVGWRQAYLVLAVAIACLLPVAVVLGLLRAGDGHPALREPPPPGSGPRHRGGSGVTLPQALRMGAFWGLGWTFCFTGIGMYTVMLQTPAFLVETGYSPQTAASAFGLIGLLAPIGMVGFGGLADRFGRRRMVLLSYALTIVGMACLAPLLAGPNDLALAGFVACFGLSFGSRGPAISTIAAGIFRGPWMGRIYGFITIGMGLGGGLGSAFGGVWHDATGGYAAGIAFAIVMVAAGSLPFFAVRDIARA